MVRYFNNTEFSSADCSVTVLVGNLQLIFHRREQQQWISWPENIGVHTCSKSENVEGSLLNSPGVPQMELLDFERHKSLDNCLDMRRDCHVLAGDIGIHAYSIYQDVEV